MEAGRLRTRRITEEDIRMQVGDHFHRLSEVIFQQVRDDESDHDRANVINNIIFGALPEAERRYIDRILEEGPSELLGNNTHTIDIHILELLGQEIEQARMNGEPLGGIDLQDHPEEVERALDTLYWFMGQREMSIAADWLSNESRDYLGVMGIRSAPERTRMLNVVNFAIITAFNILRTRATYFTPDGREVPVAGDDQTTLRRAILRITQEILGRLVTEIRSRRSLPPGERGSPSDVFEISDEHLNVPDPFQFTGSYFRAQMLFGVMERDFELPFLAETRSGDFIAASRLVLFEVARRSSGNIRDVDMQAGTVGAISMAMFQARGQLSVGRERVTDMESTQRQLISRARDIIREEIVAARQPGADVEEGYIEHRRTALVLLNAILRTIPAGNLAAVRPRRRTRA